MDVRVRAGTNGTVRDKIITQYNPDVGGPVQPMNNVAITNSRQ